MSEGIGWLPVEAREQLEEEKDRARAEQVETLLKLDPRARVLALLERAACREAEGAAACPALRAEELARLLDSFPGVVPADAAELAKRFPGMVEA